MAHRAYRTETRSQCKRERYGKDRLPEGDKDCLAWHQKTFPSFLTKDTVARCERGGDDLFHCVLKNKDIGATCPMRQDRQAKFMPSELPGNYQLRSFPCDDGKNLTCVPAWPDTTVQNIEQRKIFLGLDRTNAMGVCRSK